MSLFLLALAVLVGGYFIYGALVERIVGTDPKRATPATALADGVDYIALPTWKVFLIQFLNIAGVGPIFGAIMGVMFGPAAFLWIALGTVFAGAVHDFMSGILSLRNDGRSITEIVGRELGQKVKALMVALTVFLLVMVVAVFVRTPAGLLAAMTPEWLDATMWTVIIFCYYILATLLPIDKVIGRIYPLFGIALLFMAVGIACYMCFSPDVHIPASLSELATLHSQHSTLPVFPMMFVSIACGAISGFHATQSPLMARCLKSEKHARPVFYGAMVAEGIVALVWAAAAIAFTGSYQGLSDLLAEHGNDAGWLVNEICNSWLGVAGGILAILGVVAAPITSGDTAMRSCRLILADALGMKQDKLWRTLLMAAPVIVASFVLMQLDFTVLWRYFAWSNQTLSVFTLWACTLWLARTGRTPVITLLPALFMTAVCTTYILYAPTGVASADAPGLPLMVATSCGLGASLLCLGLFIVKRPKLDMA